MTVRHNLGSLMALVCLATPLVACSVSVSPEKQALQHCQDRARAKMRDVAGNPRYRNPKTQIEKLKSGPNDYQFRIKGEYFYKTVYSGDKEMRFTCTVSKSADAAEWTVNSFDAVCTGGCT